jgi:uncharacterized protein (TIRG00374 family)
MRAHLRTALVLACTVALLALFLRQANLGEVWLEIRRADPAGLFGALAMTGVTYFLRSWRWRVMLRPIGRARLWTAFRTTVIGFAANALLPARAGEVLRPFLLARREGLSATATFATIVLERLLDLVTVLLFFGLFVLVADPRTTAADPVLFGSVKVGGMVTTAGSVLGLVVVFLLAGHPERLGNAARRVERVLPARLAHALARTVERFAEGFAVMRRPGPLLQAAALSVPLWLSIAMGIWLVARAFHITMSFAGSFLVMALLTVGVAVPTPGAVGGFHYAFRVGAMAFFGAPAERAVGAAIVLHAIAFLPVTLLGLLFMLQDGLDLGRLRRLASDRSLGDGGAGRVEPSASGPAGVARHGGGGAGA